jgi:hypothetical protein
MSSQSKQTVIAKRARQLEEQMARQKRRLPVATALAHALGATQGAVSNGGQVLLFVDYDKAFELLGEATDQDPEALRVFYALGGV